MLGGVENVIPVTGDAANLSTTAAQMGALSIGERTDGLFVAVFPSVSTGEGRTDKWAGERKKNMERNVKSSPRRTPTTPRTPRLRTGLRFVLLFYSLFSSSVLSVNA